MSAAHDGSPYRNSRNSRNRIFLKKLSCVHAHICTQEGFLINLLLLLLLLHVKHLNSDCNEDKILYKKRTRNALLPRLRPTRSESKNVELDTTLHRTAKTNRNMPLQQVCQVLHCQGGGAHLGILRHTRRHMTRKTGAPIS